MVEGQRPRADHVGLLKRPREYTANELEWQPNAGVSETVWSKTALGVQGGRHGNPQVWIPVWLEPRAQEAVLATAAEPGSICPRGGSTDRGIRRPPPPPPVSRHMAYRRQQRPFGQFVYPGNCVTSRPKEFLLHRTIMSVRAPAHRKIRASGAASWAGVRCGSRATSGRWLLTGTAT
jgi:hypothetical protein